MGGGDHVDEPPHPRGTVGTRLGGGVNGGRGETHVLDYCHLRRGEERRDNGGNIASVVL